MPTYLSQLSLAALALLAGASAHTWVEQMQEINSNGTFTGAMGYPRGYVARTEASFNGDSMDYLLPPLASGRTRIDASDLLCHPAQRTRNQTAGWPMLTTSPGNYVALKYLENGHVTLPQNQPGKPPGAGSVYVFGTTKPWVNETIDTVLHWTTDGTGGDGRGRLITSQNFDDGRCHQLNGGAISLQRQQEFPDRVPGQPTSNVEQWCEADVQIPADADIGTHTLYFVWDWATRPGVPGLPDGKDEYYTTCMDVNVVAIQQNEGIVAAPQQESQDQFALLQQDPQTKAVATFTARSAYKMDPLEAYATVGTGQAAYATMTPTGVSEQSATQITPSVSLSSTISAGDLMSTAPGPMSSTASMTTAPEGAPVVMTSSSSTSCAGWPSIYSGFNSTSSSTMLTSTPSSTPPVVVTSIVYATTVVTIKSTVSSSTQSAATTSPSVDDQVTVTDYVTVTASMSMPTTSDDAQTSSTASAQSLILGPIDQVQEGPGYGPWKRNWATWRA